MPRFFQALVAFLAMIVTLPLLVLSLLLSSLFIGFPPIHRSRRTGRGGREYTHWKIRSMKSGRETGRIFFEADRLNPCGRFLRRFHLDELPELFLIIWGKMDIVGPRPLPTTLLEGLDTSVRNTVRPGWTGPAQVWLLRRGRLDKRLQIRLDDHYVRHRSWCYDCRIILATLCGVFNRRPLNMDPAGSDDRKRFVGELDRGPGSRNDVCEDISCTDDD